MTQRSADPVGIFDSGIGGLTVTRGVVDRLPFESLLYLGDTARVPYGNKSPETIQRYSLNISARLQALGAKALVIACNTATAAALERVQAEVSVPVVGVIEPVCQEALQHTQEGCVGVIGTQGTVRSGAYIRALQRLRPDLEVVQQACPLFVPLAEEGWLRGAVPHEVARAYLARFEGTRVDTLILGCTHYPLLRTVIEEVIQEVVGRPVLVLDSASATAEALARVLGEAALMSPPRHATHRFFVTDDPSSFQASCDRFFGAPLAKIEHIDL